MMTEHQQQEEVNDFISGLTPEQIRTALALYMLRSSPLEELIATGQTLFAMLADADLDPEIKEEVKRLEERFGFWVGLC